MRAIKIIIGIVLVVIVAAIVLTDPQLRTTSRASAHVGETWYSEEDIIGCRSRDDLTRLGSLANQNDREASLKLLFQKSADGQCRVVKSGLPLYVETADNSGFPCVRPQGDPYCLHMAERQLRRLQ